MRKTFKVFSILILVLVFISACDFGGSSKKAESPLSPNHVHAFDSITRQCSCGIIEDGVVAYIGETFEKATARFMTLQDGVNYLANQQKDIAKGNSKNTIHGYKSEINCAGIVIDNVEVEFDFSKSTVKFTGTQGIVVKGKNSKVEISGKKLEGSDTVATLIKIEEGSLAADIEFKGSFEAKDAEIVISGANVEITGFVDNSVNANKIKLTSPSITLSLPLETVQVLAAQIEEGSTSKPVIPEHTHSFPQEPNQVEGATCLKEGFKKYTCPECGYSYYEVVAKSAHSLNHHSETEETREYWECSVCNKLFLDSEGTVETDSNGIKTANYFTIGEIDSNYIPGTSTISFDEIDKKEFSIVYEDKYGYYILYYPKELKDYFMDNYGLNPNSGDPIHDYYIYQLDVNKDSFLQKIVEKDIELPKPSYWKTQLEGYYLSDDVS